MIDKNNHRVSVGISSLLKPVNDVRMYEKFALSISKHTDFSIEVIGFKAENLPENSKIKFHTLFDFRRLSLKRIFSSLDFYKKILQLKVDVSICNSPDFQLFNTIYRIIFGKKIMYDVRENYVYNIFYLDNFSWFLKGTLGCLYRMKEWMVAPWNACFILAEQSYKEELLFVGNRSVLLENKLALSSDMPLLKAPLKNAVVLSGTISRGYGLYMVLKWADGQYKENNLFRLVVSGFCPMEADYDYLKTKAKDAGYIDLRVSKSPKPHYQILDDLAGCESGILLYPDSKAFVKCVPTKLYELLHYRLCVVISRNLFWERLVDWYAYPLSDGNSNQLYWDKYNELVLNYILRVYTNL